MWILLALWTAFFESIKDAISKHNLKNTDPYIMSWIFRFISFLFVLPLIFFIDIPVIDKQFWITLLCSSVLNTATTIMYMKALKIGELSNTVPFIALTPCFLLITSPILVGEFPSIWWFFGVLIGVFGAYILSYKSDQKSLFSPFVHLFSNQWSRLMLLVAFIFSITSNLDKIGIVHSSPLFWLIAINWVLSIFLFPIMILFSDKSYRETLAGWKYIVLWSGVWTLALVFQVQALSLTLVSYVISVKRMSAVFWVLIGYFIFKEKYIWPRLLWSILMVTSVFFIILT